MLNFFTDYVIVEHGRFWTGRGWCDDVMQALVFDNKLDADCERLTLDDPVGDDE